MVPDHLESSFDLPSHLITTKSPARFSSTSRHAQLSILAKGSLSRQTMTRFCHAYLPPTSLTPLEQLGKPVRTELYSVVIPGPSQSGLETALSAAEQSQSALPVDVSPSSTQPSGGRRSKRIRTTGETEVARVHTDISIVHQYWPPAHLGAICEPSIVSEYDLLSVRTDSAYRLVEQPTPLDSPAEQAHSPGKHC